MGTPHEIEIRHATHGSLTTRDGWVDHDDSLFATVEELNQSGDDVCWTITHIKTGFKFPRLEYRSRKRALDSIRRLEALADWSVITPDPKDYGKVVGITPDLQNIAKAFTEAEAA